MTPYIAFKRALIDGCLTCPVTRIAEMIMIDVGLPHQKIVSNWPDYDAINKFIISMNMPRMYGKEMDSSEAAISAAQRKEKKKRHGK